MADEDAPPAPESHEAPYLMQMPDGSVQSRVLQTDRPVTHGELSGYVASQGGVYLGPPPPPAPPPTTTTTLPPALPPPPEPFVGPSPYVPPEVQRMESPTVEREWAAERARTAPAPVPTPAPRPQVVAPPNLFQAFGGYDMGGGAALSQALAPPALPEAPPGTERVVGAITAPRSLKSQALPIIGATVLGRAGTSAATPLGPEIAIPVGMASAGAGGFLGEGGQILLEKATGAEPAEPGGAWPRMVNAAIRSATFEGLTAPLRALPIAVASSARPAAEAMQELEPVLTGREAGPLADWWAKWSARPAAEMAAEWARLGKTGEQAALAGDRLPAMRDMMAAVTKGAGPISKGESVAYGGSVAHVFTGHPGGYLVSAYPATRAFVREATPVVMSSIARGAPESPWLLQLPRTAQAAGPLFSTAVRVPAQVLGTQRWGAAETTLPPSPQP